MVLGNGNGYPLSAAPGKSVGIGRAPLEESWGGSGGRAEAQPRVARKARAESFILIVDSNVLYDEQESDQDGAREKGGFIAYGHGVNIDLEYVACIHIIR